MGGHHGGPMDEKLPHKEEILEKVFAAWSPRPEMEIVSLPDAAGRVLAEDLTAMYNIPVVRASAMDGIAICAASVQNGIPDTTLWRLGQDYVRADTGDDFPDAFDTVIPIEQVTLHPDGGVSFEQDIHIHPGMHVHPSGSQIQRGDAVGKKGTVLTALDLAAIGMGGYDHVGVIRRPRVAFVPTGSELVPVGSTLRRGQNFDTNSLLAAQMIRDMGGEPILRSITSDDPARLRAELDSLLPIADIVILNAGTSKGDEDYCGRMLEESGTSLFHGVAAVPGRPMGAAILDGKLVLNLSGPALAAFYSLDWLVRPSLCRFLGIPVPQRRRVQAVLTETLHCPPPMSLLCMLEVRRNPDGGYLATPLAIRGPHAVRSSRMLTANALYATVPGEPHHQAGETISVELLRDLI